MTAILVTGAAGFIGFHVAQRYLQEGRAVVGLDNLNDYYDPNLKLARLERLKSMPGFQFVRADLADAAALAAIFREGKFEVVVHLAAQAGVRYSLINPQSYVQSNLVGFANLLEMCRHHGTRHLIYASSSSVYGASQNLPFSVHQNVDHPLSLYAATKKSNELLAHTYSHLFGLPATGLRFFTVYGPWGRPDMALFLFTQAMLEGKPIKVFNHGQMKRDFTYIDDVVDGVFRLTDHLPVPDSALEREASGPGHKHRALSPLQYRQQQVGSADASHRGLGAVPRRRSQKGISADAAGRRARDLRRHRGPGARGWLSAAHGHRTGRGEVRRMVQKFLPRVIRPM